VADWELRTSITLDQPGQVQRGKHFRQLLDQVEYLSQGAPVGMAYKLSNTAVDNTSGGSSYQNDPHLSFEAEANEVIRIYLDVVWDAHATPDFKQRFQAPAGAQFEAISYAFGNASAAAARVLQAANSTCEVTGVGGAGVGILMYFTLWATLFMGSTSGTVNWQWAQNLSDANDTTVWKGSVLEYKRAG
jgi:hypothetical protein